MNIHFQHFINMNAEERAWVRELVERFAWPVSVACQQVRFFGICERHVYDYRNGVVVDRA